MARLHKGFAASVNLVSCDAAVPLRSQEGFMADPHFVIPLDGSYVWHSGRNEVFADANQILYFPGDQSYATSHPVSGEISLALMPTRSALEEIAALGGYRLQDVFRFRVRPASFQTQLAARQLVATTAGADDSAALEETVLELLLKLLGVEGGGDGDLDGARNAVRLAKEFIQAALPGQVALPDVAAAVGVHPVYLSQSFKRLEGLPLYQYVLKLRLGASLNELGRCDDITGLALDFGFSSHSHFTSVFTSRYRIAPSLVRSRLRNTLPAISLQRGRIDVEAAPSGI